MILSWGVEEAGCKIYSGAPTVSQTTDKIRQEDPNFQKTDMHPFEADTKGRHSSSSRFLLTGQLAEGGRPIVCWLVGCLTSQQHASVSQGRICTDNFTCCHTEVEVADPTFYLTQSHYTDTGPTSPSSDSIMPGAWQVASGVSIFKSLVWLDPEKSRGERDSNPGSFTPEADALTTKPTKEKLADQNTWYTKRWLRWIHLVRKVLRHW